MANETLSGIAISAHGARHADGALAAWPARLPRQPKPAADDATNVSCASLNELQSEVRELKDLVQQLKQETTASRAEMTRLRQELESERIAAYATASSRKPASPPDATCACGQLEEEQQLLSGKVDEQYQTKVESASKYRVRLSGVVLFNLFSNQGTVDNMDVPTLAYQGGGLEIVRILRRHTAAVDLRLRSIRAAGHGSQNQRQRELRCRRWLPVHFRTE